MKVSKKGEYALRATIFLARNYDRGNVQIKDIASEENIPKKFLEQIMIDLKKSGLLQSKTGYGGGYSLIKAPDQITLASIIRAIDGPLAPVSCVSKMAHIECPREGSCGLKSIMNEVRNAIADILENRTLADVIKPQK
jgi:Rrf2 family protein